MIFGLVFTKKEPLVRLHDGGKIRCPKCAWEPTKADRWLCDPGCGHVWNTFDTHGCCPGCAKRWAETVCFRCQQWSTHDDWYVSDDPD
jgi:hypothetical protein